MAYNIFKMQSDYCSVLILLDFFVEFLIKVLLAKTKSNTIEVLISKAWIDSYINHNEFDSVNKIIREYNEMEEKIKSFKNAVEYYI